MQIKKRFFSKGFVDYLYLTDEYSIGTKPRKQQVFVKGGVGYVYKTKPSEKKAIDAQRAYSEGQPGSWRHFMVVTKVLILEVSDGMLKKHPKYPQKETV